MKTTKKRRRTGAKKRGEVWKVLRPEFYYLKAEKLVSVSSLVFCRAF